MEKLIVKNFKAIEYAEIEVNDLTFFIGQQASGKSTLAKLVYFFKTLGNNINSYLDFNKEYFDAGELWLSIWNIIEKIFYYNFSENDKLAEIIYQSESYVVEIYIDETGFFNLKVNNEIEFSDVLYPQIKDMQEILENGVSISNRAYQFLDKKIKETIKLYFPTKLYVDYLPANRSLFTFREKDISNIKDDIFENIQNYISSKTVLDYSSFSENDFIYAEYIHHILYLKDIYSRTRGFELEDEQLTLKVREKIRKIILGDYLYDEEGEKIILKDSKKYVRLQDASSGQQEVIRLIQDIFAVVFSPSVTAFRVYEEPEAHLFPASQKALMEMIVILLNANPNVQLLISTHTPYLLAVLNILMKAKELEKQLGENSDALDSLVPKEERLDVKRVCVYSAKQTENGKFIFENVVNQGAQSIDAEILDEVTEQIEIIYEQLLDLQVSISN